MRNKRVLVVDGMNCFYRHFVANPSMSDNGDHVGGIVGFLKGIQLLSERYTPRDIIVVWEGGGSPRRRSIDPSYKGGRRPEKLNRFYSEDIPDTVSNRNEQVSKLVNLLRLAGVRQMYVSDCEADDVIARLVNVNFKDHDCVIISTDRDFFQLINDRVAVWSPGSKKEWSSELVVENHGIHPENFCLARCFVGDSSDGIKGVPGAGFRTLAKRFPELSYEESVTIDDILTKCRELREQKALKIYDNIISREEAIKKNWKLMYLGHGNLSGNHIQKIDGVLNTESPSRNKLKFIRALAILGIRNFDYDKLFMSLRILRRG